MTNPLQGEKQLPCPHGRPSWKSCPHCLGINNLKPDPEKHKHSEHSQRHLPGHKHLYCDESCWPHPPIERDWEKTIREWVSLYNNFIQQAGRPDSEKHKAELSPENFIHNLVALISRLLSEQKEEIRGEVERRPTEQKITYHKIDGTTEVRHLVSKSSVLSLTTLKSND